MFELSRSLPVCSYSSPIIRPSDIFMDACIDHRLNGKYVAGFHDTYSLVTWVVRNVRSGVEQFSSTMAAVCSVYWEAIFLDEFCDNVTDLPVHSAGLADGNGFLEAFVGFGDEKFAWFCNFAHKISLIEINMKAIFEDCDIKVNNISIFQRSVVGNSVANDFVNWAEVKWKVTCIKTWGICSSYKVMGRLSVRWWKRGPFSRFPQWWCLLWQVNDRNRESVLPKERFFVFFQCLLSNWLIFIFET